jgi:hypothetical protein
MVDVKCKLGNLLKIDHTRIVNSSFMENGLKTGHRITFGGDQTIVSDILVPEARCTTAALMVNSISLVRCARPEIIALDELALQVCLP